MPKSTSRSPAAGKPATQDSGGTRKTASGARAPVVEAFELTADSGKALSPRLFYETVQQSPLAISITDSHANILYVNPAFESLTGYASEAVLGENESILSHRQTPAEVYGTLWSTIKGGNTWRGTLVNRRQNGDAYLAELNISPVFDAQGRINYFLGIHRDITEVHALEQQVRHQKALIESMLDAAPVVVALIDADGNVLVDNQAYKKLLGDLHAREPAALFLEAMEEDGFDLATAAAAERNFSEVEVRLDMTGRSGPRWYSLSGTWVSELDSTVASFFGNGSTPRRCLLLVAAEITALRQQMDRARLQHLRASLAEQERVQGMREALAGAIFQLQTPVNIIKAAVGMLDRGTDGSQLRGVLDQVLQSGEQALETLRGAQPAETREPETSLNLNTLLQDVLTLQTEAFLARGVVIDWQPQTVLPSITGRPNQLRSMFMRLVENALLAADECTRAQRLLRIVTGSREDCVEVLIQDNGPGIPDNLRLKVFEPFYSGWTQARGRAGMGLSLAQEAVNEHGGVIDINPDTSDGCQVRVTFPVRSADNGYHEGLH